MNEGRKMGSLRCVEGGTAAHFTHEDKKMDRVLEEYDATPLIGLRAVVINAAVKSDEEDTVEVPKLRELLAAAAIVRCLMPIKLRGYEIKAIRKIMQCTLADLAKKMGENTAPETVSRWEAEAQPMGGYAEKVLRLVVCEKLKAEAPGVEYKGEMIALLNVKDPWKTDAHFEVPPIPFAMTRMKEQSGAIIDAWDFKQAA